MQKPQAASRTNAWNAVGLVVLVCTLRPYAVASAPAGQAPPGPVPANRVVVPTTITPKGAARGQTLDCVVETGPRVPVTAVALSPDGKALATGGYKEVLLWSLAEPGMDKRIGAGLITGQVQRLLFLKDGRLAVAEGVPARSGVVRLFELDTAKQTAAFEQPKDVLYALAQSPDGRLLAAGGADKTAYVWDVNDSKLLKTITDHSDWVTDVAFSADGKFLVTGSADMSARVWDVATWNTTTNMQQLAPVHGCAFDSRAQLVAVAVGGAKDRGVRIRRKDGGRQTLMAWTGAAMPLRVLWKNKPNNLYVACSDNTVKVYEASRARLIKTLTGHDDWVYDIAVNADGTRLASASADGTVKLWDPVQGTLLATLVQPASGADHWLIATPQGYLAASSAEKVRWTCAKALPQRAELEKLLLKPERVRDVLAGKKVAGAVLP